MYEIKKEDLTKDRVTRQLCVPNSYIEGKKHNNTSCPLGKPKMNYTSCSNTIYIRASSKFPKDWPR